jgi:hypothetical protein
LKRCQDTWQPLLFDLNMPTATFFATYERDSEYTYIYSFDLVP